MSEWSYRNLGTQCYDLSPEQARALRVGLRFPTAVCFGLVVTALATGSALLMAVLIPVGIAAGWSKWHPFDLVWNHAVRHLMRSPAVPPTPRRRRHAFKLGAVWVFILAALLGSGHQGIAVALAAPLLAVCGLVTVTNYCIPSTLLSLLEARRAKDVLRNTPRSNRERNTL